ncbi:MAG: Hemolysin activator protein [Candidatus Gallionella acididurans]|uniref:Hemolysin activator protein n=1 Tax=Candidatus Gallionella acididurans TaxID=1796491 RepID=A0A139BVC7_9PROT|nr:MAG: Hemolysin activator protein [Candidatus Gallionella acididurans]
MSDGYAAVDTTDTEELRNRAMQQAQERARQQQAPNVNLQGAVPEAQPFQLPAAETPCFTVNTFVLEVPGQLSPAAHRYGASTSLLDHFHFAQKFLDQYKGKCIGREGINILVKGVTTKILERGYSTTRVAIPEQDMLSGTLKLTLIPGIIHELRFADAGTAGTWKNAFPTSAGKLLNLRDLEQGLEQMKRVTSQDVSMQIVPAGNLGESDVIISVKRSKPWNATINLDDSGIKATGKTQAGLQAGWDNLLGINDLFNIGTSTDADRNNYMRGTSGNNFSYSVPFGYWTSSVSANEFAYHQRIMGIAQSFVSSGKMQNLDAKVSYLFYRDQFSKSSLQFRTGKYFSHSYIDDTEILVQKRDTTFAEIALIHKHYIGQAQIDATLACRKGTPWFGAQSDPANLPSTSPRYDYTLETLDATLTMPFQLNERQLSYSATLRAQNTNTALYAEDWFSIGNRWTVRGFDGEYPMSAEKGFFLRNEIGIPIFGTAQSAYVGLDFGAVYGNNTATLLGNKLAGLVAGLRGSIAQGMMYEVFAGFSLYKPEYYPTDVPAAGFSLMYQM